MPEAIYSCRRVRLAVARRRVDGYTLVVNRDSDFYAGRLPEAEIARTIVGSAGRRGHNRDYLVNTVRHLDTLGIGDGAMHRLLDLVGKQAGEYEKAARAGGAKEGSEP